MMEERLLIRQQPKQQEDGFGNLKYHFFFQIHSPINTEMKREKFSVEQTQENSVVLMRNDQWAILRS